MSTNTTTVLDCGHEPTPTAGSCGTGYATDATTGRMCYPCADSAMAAQVARAVPGDRIDGLYLSSDGRTITTWTGGVIMTRVRMGKRHSFSPERHHLYAFDVDGRRWAGTGAEGMWCTLRLCKR